MVLSLRSRQLCAAGLASVCALLMAGCAGFDTTATTISPVAGSSAVLSGRVHGGQNPVTNASVRVWAAGNAGYGSAATVLASTTSDGGGNYSFTTPYACPLPTSTTTSQYLYMTATGGQTGGIANSNISLIAPLGLCSSVIANPPVVSINEETTIGTMFALAQFFQPAVSGVSSTQVTGNIGTSATNLTGLANALKTATNLVNNQAGQSIVSTVSGTVAGYTTAPTITITPEITKINTEANILAACINSDPSKSTNCSTLENAVSATAALDTLQAAYYLAVNPTSQVGANNNIATIYGLAASNPPFAPALTAAPTDWTLGITYGTSSSQTLTGATTPTYLITDPEYLAIDASGNVWMANYASGTATTGGNGSAPGNSVTELSNAGTPLNQVLTNNIDGPAAITIDPSGNVWVPSFGKSAALATFVNEYTTTAATNTYTVSAGPQALASDGSGNIFVVSPSYKGAGAVSEIAASTATGTTITPFATGLTTDFSNLAIDANATIWITGGGSATTTGGTSGYDGVFQFLYSKTGTAYAATPNNTFTSGVTAPENAISVDSANNVFVSNYAKSTISEFSGTTSVTANTNSPIATSTNLTKPQFSAIDGSGAYWVTQASLQTATPPGSVFAYSNAGVALSPSVGFAHTYNEPYGIAIDASGNVWVGSYNATASATAAGFITEIVGAAVPVVTPIAAGLPVTAGGTSKLGTRP